jgi:hypothetical protein
MGCVCHDPRPSGHVCHDPRTTAAGPRGMGATTPVLRGMGATTPKRGHASRRVLAATSVLATLIRRCVSMTTSRGTRALRMVFDDAGEIDPGPDVQLVEDVAQVGVHGVG